MPNPFVPQRHSIRLKNYDYSQAGAYFVTIVTQGREKLFGDIKGSKMGLNPYGLIVQQTWNGLPAHYSHIQLDEFCILPNHVHGIIWITGDDFSSGRGGFETRPYADLPRQPLSEIVRAFKTFSARRINELRRTPGAPIWQRNYYEHILRSESELNRVREYILANPFNWESDQENPALFTVSH